MTPIQVRLTAAFKEAAASGAWYRVEDVFETLMWRSEPLPTPTNPNIPWRSPAVPWPEPTYTRLLFVSLARGKIAWTVVIRRSSAPWIPTREERVSLTHAINVLNFPEDSWS